jgi:hypothetical protein
MKTLKPEDLRKKYGNRILLNAYPKPYPDKPSGTKAILLGCDPSNIHCNSLPYVFAINSSHKVFAPFVKQWDKMLDVIGLTRDTVYIQNLCRNYFTEESSKNKIWATVAKEWIPVLKDELKRFDKDIPVLLTSELLYKVLVEKRPLTRAADFYNLREGLVFPIPAEENELNRPLIPFYRHRDYNLVPEDKFPGYKDAVRKIVR